MGDNEVRMATLTDAMEERRLRIEQGEQAAEAAEQALNDAKADSAALIKQAQSQKDGILADADKAAKAHVESTRQDAKAMAERMIKQAENDVAQQMLQAKGALQADVATMVVALTEKLLGETMSGEKNAQLVTQWLSEHE